MSPQQLAACYPRLYHIAECGAWPGIRRHGLLSTAAALEHCGIHGSRATALLRKHRAQKTAIGVGEQTVWLRDQLPMPPERLARALRDGLTPAQWYALINAKVFLWAEEARMLRLLGARYNRDREHDVLVLDTASLLGVHASAVWLCPMNSGNTSPFPVARGRDTFRRIADYPTRRSGRPIKPVVEVAVDHRIADVATHVLEVRRMRAGEQGRVLHARMEPSARR